LREVSALCRNVPERSRQLDKMFGMSKEQDRKLLKKQLKE